MRLEAAEAARLLPLLAPLAGRFPTEAAFADWRRGFVAAIASGELGAFAHAHGAVVYRAAGGLALLLAGLGEVGDALLHAAVTALQAEQAGLLWGPECPEGWASRLAGLGLRPYALETFYQDLGRVAFPPLPADGPALAPWQPEDLEPVLALLLAANRDSLAGLMLTQPALPTPASLEAFMRALLDGSLGGFLPLASQVARLEGAIAGVALAARREDGLPVLLELATHPAARGRQVARCLVVGMQQALLREGFREMVFFTTADNAPIHRLFRPEEILRHEVTRGGYWLRANP